MERDSREPGELSELLKRKMRSASATPAWNLPLVRALVRSAWVTGCAGSCHSASAQRASATLAWSIGLDSISDRSCKGRDGRFGASAQDPVDRA